MDLHGVLDTIDQLLAFRAVATSGRIIISGHVRV